MAEVKLLLTLIAIILSLMLAPTISAKSSDAFINHLTDLIWTDCKGKDIHINQSILNYTIENRTSYLKLIEWPYDRGTIRRIIELFGEGQSKFETFFGTCDDKGVTITGINGCGILTCGENRLNINGYNYFWNGVKVDVPKEELFNIASGDNNTQVINKGEGSSTNIGNNNIANTGDKSTITQQDLNISFVKGTIFGAVIGILLKFLYDIFSRKYLK